MQLTRFHRSEGAQGLIEFALISPLLLLLFLGVVDFSRFMYYDNAIRSAARTGAEVASNHCFYPYNCAESSAAATDDYVMQAVACEARPYVYLNPQPSTCSPCLSNSCTSPYASDPCSPSCSQDVYIDPAYAPGSSVTDASGADVTVSVGYDFRPITPIIGKFFSTQSCYPGDTGTHTLCATFVGRVD